MPCMLEALDSGPGTADNQAQWPQHLEVEVGESEFQEWLTLSTQEF